MATRRTSTIGLTKVTADHPAIKGLNPSLQEIVLKNVADADKDADGRLDIDEFVALQVNTAMNVEAAAKKEARLENQVKYSLMTVVLSLLGNFGLIWAVVALTQKLGSQNGAIVDSKTNEMLSTRTGTLHVTALENTEYLNSVLAAQEKGDGEEDLLALTETPMGTVGLDMQGAFATFEQYVNGAELTCDTGSAGSTLIWIINGMHVYTPGGTLKDQPCDVYDEIEVKDAGLYKLECCPTHDFCSYYFSEEGSRRILQSHSRRLAYKPVY